MKALVVYAHPATGGHCNFILEEIKKNLVSRNIRFEVIDLYKIKYDPVLHEEEHYASGNRKVSPQNRKFQEKIKNSDMLVFVYPVWWASMPAILKGFLDRIFTPGFAFRYEEGIPKKLLNGKRALVFFTTGGPTIYYKLLVNTPKKVIKNKTLEFFGIKTKVVQFGSSIKLDDKKKKIMAGKVKKEISKLKI